MSTQASGSGTKRVLWPARELEKLKRLVNRLEPKDSNDWEQVRRELNSRNEYVDWRSIRSLAIERNFYTPQTAPSSTPCTVPEVPRVISLDAGFVSSDGSNGESADVEKFVQKMSTVPVIKTWMWSMKTNGEGETTLHGYVSKDTNTLTRIISKRIVRIMAEVLVVDMLGNLYQLMRCEQCHQQSPFDIPRYENPENFGTNNLGIQEEPINLPSTSKNIPHTEDWDQTAETFRIPTGGHLHDVTPITWNRSTRPIVHHTVFNQSTNKD